MRAVGGRIPTGGSQHSLGADGSKTSGDGWPKHVKEVARSSPQTMLHVVGSLDIGGAELRLLDLCRSLHDGDPRQVFLTLAGRRGAIADRFESFGATVEQCALHPMPTFPYRAYRTISRIAPDSITSHVSLVSGFMLCTARAAGVPKRVAWIRSDGDGRRSTILRRLMRRALRWMLRSSATTVLAVSQAALEFAIPDITRFTGRTMVIPNGVDTHRFRPLARQDCRVALDLTPTCVVLAHIGRASPEKNRPFLVEIDDAMRKVEHTFLLAGPGGVADIDPHDTSRPTMRFLGTVEDIPQLLGAADVLVLPSIREGLPGAVLEALSCGVPVVANDIPTLRELAGALPGIQMVGVELGPDAWRDAILRAEAMSDDERRLIRESLSVSKYTLENAAEQWRATW